MVQVFQLFGEVHQREGSKLGDGEGKVHFFLTLLVTVLVLCSAYKIRRLTTTYLMIGSYPAISIFFGTIQKKLFLYSLREIPVISDSWKVSVLWLDVTFEIHVNRETCWINIHHCQLRSHYIWWLAFF